MAVILSSRDRRGFTLLEVMVALAILAITLTSIYRLHAQTMVMSARARFYSQAPMLAQAKLAEMERKGIENSEDASGDFGDEHPGYSWSVRIEDANGALISEFLKDGQQHLVRIDVTITLGEEDTYALRTYRYYSE
ncbi:MAG: prepilin-type N-terminal cleavage/methylation domain-containing protein [Desulfosarcinaceae bacterium]